MSCSNTPRRRKQRVDLAEDEQRVRDWLLDADQQEFDNDVSKTEDRAPAEPATPPRRQQLAHQSHEISPTNTSFSVGSVFDLPNLPDVSCTEDSLSDIPDIVPADDQYWYSKSKTERCRTGIGLIFDVFARFDSDSLASQGSPSEAADDLDASYSTLEETLYKLATSPIVANQPRFTEITACTQCIIADLPCSRTVPCCSRCKRNGQEDVCLIHRQQYSEEISQSDASTCTAPVLLKLRDEDEVLWQKKLRLAAELDALWRAAEDRKNWVLPSLDGLAGNFQRDGGHLQKSSPGKVEERGLRWRELHVAMDR